VGGPTGPSTPIWEVSVNEKIAILIEQQTRVALEQSGAAWLVVAKLQAEENDLLQTEVSSLFDLVDELTQRINVLEAKQTPVEQPIEEAAEAVVRAKERWGRKAIDDGPGELNGFSCKCCGAPLRGARHNFVNKAHANHYYYLKEKHPERLPRPVKVKGDPDHLRIWPGDGGVVEGSVEAVAAE
jgi:hypothetical protein